MEETKGELEAALLQAKNECIAIQQQIWDHDKHELRQGEDLYVKRFLYAVTVARKTRYYNGYRPSDVPRSKSLTRIFMEQRYHRSKSSPPSLQKQDRSEPKVTLSDSTDGVTTRIEFIETVEESPLRELIKNDLEECAQLARKLPRDRRDWEHVRDVHLQVSNGVPQRGATFRMGEHLYGFDNIRDLSFNVADQVDMFFGRKPSSALLYQSPYHFLHDYIEDYGRVFFNSTLSRSAHDLSEWRKQHLETPSIDSPLSLSEVDLSRTDAVRVDEHHEPYRPSTTVSDHQRDVSEKRFTTNEWWSSSFVDYGGSNEPRQWESVSDRTGAYDFTKNSSILPNTGLHESSSMDHLASSSYDHRETGSGGEKMNDKQYSSLHSLEYQKDIREEPFNFSHHSMGDYRSDSANETTHLVYDEPDLNPMLQAEDRIRTTISSSTPSTLDHLSTVPDSIEASQLRSPSSAYSDMFSDQKTSERNTHSVIGGSDSERMSTTLNSGEHRYDPYATDTTSSTVVKKEYREEAKTANQLREKGVGGNKSGGDELSDSETLVAPRSPDSMSESTLLPDDKYPYEVETLAPTAELEETHLNIYVDLVPPPHLSKPDETHNRNREAELLLHDVHCTHRVLQEEIDKYENKAWLKGNSPKEVVYDSVAADPKNIYDAVYDQNQVHHAHGAIVLSEPVQRPLAVSPPIYEEVPEERPHVEELHYAETELSKRPHYTDDENIYAEIKDIPQVPTKQGSDVTSDINYNINKEQNRALIDNTVNASLEIHQNIPFQRKKEELATRKQTPYYSSEIVHAKLVNADYDDVVKEKDYDVKINRELNSKHQIIHELDEKQRFSTEENRSLNHDYHSAKPIPSPTFQRLQHAYTPEDIRDHGGSQRTSLSGNRDYDMNKYEGKSEKELPKGDFDRETALATVAIRRMSRRNQWTDDEEESVGSYDVERARPLLSPRISSPRVHSPNSAETKIRPAPLSPGKPKASEPEISHSHMYHEHVYGKYEKLGQTDKERQRNTTHYPAAVFDERTYQGITLNKDYGSASSLIKSTITTSSSSTHDKTTHRSRILAKSEENLRRADDLQFVPVETAGTYKGPATLPPYEAVSAPSNSAGVATIRKGFVLEMAKKYEEEHPDNSSRRPLYVKHTKKRAESQNPSMIGTGAVPTPRSRSVPSRELGSSKISVQEKVYAIEHTSPVEYSYNSMQSVSNDEDSKSSRERMVSIGTKESLNLDEMDLPRWSPHRGVDSSLNQENVTIVHRSEVVDHISSKPLPATPRIPPLRDLPQSAAEPPVEAEQAEEEPVILQRNGSGRRSWPVKTYEYVDISRQKLKMPDIETYVRNGNLPHPEKVFGEENAVLRDWNPRALVRTLYEVSYEPRVETKRNRFISMEGHVEVPSDETSTVAELERHWKQLYMRTKEGRLQIFVSHCADEAPAEEIVLSGVDVDANREERTLTIHGGRDHIRMTLRVQSNVFDKWRHSLLSHAASSQIDAYVKPIPKTFQHLTERVVVLELGSCSIRGGLLTTEPSLPQSFFPSIAVRTDDGKIVVGEDAYAPEVRHHGEFVRPIQALDPVVERYTMDYDVVKACVQKVVRDLNVNPLQYKILLSIPQNIPIALIGQLLTLVLKDIGFQGAAITRQPSLILYAYDVTTGVVVDIGDRLNIVPVIDGYVVESAICSIPYGATQVREALRTTLCSNNKGLYSFQSPIEKLILRYVLEQTSYVPEDYAQEEKTSKEVNVSLDKFDPIPGMPTKFSIDNSRFLCTEGLFRPKKWGLDTKGLHQLIHEAVQLSPIDSRRTLYRNIYLAGGASLMPGLAEKLEQELAAIVPNTIHTQVHISPWRYNAAYLGAQIVASASTFSDSCVSLENLPTFLAHLQSSCF